MSRSRPPQSDPLWGDSLPEEQPERKPAGHPPDWALPSWDTVPVEDEEARSRSKPASVPPVPVASVPPMPPAASANPDVRPPLGSAPLARGLTAESSLRILGVSDVTRAIRDAVRAEPALREVWVEGEVGRVTVSSAGHAYFTLKDERSQLACVFFRDNRVGSPFEPRTGLRLVVQGRIDIFEAQGVYQLYVMSVQPAGFGDLALRFEALKAKLAAEGLFDAARKRQLPGRPAVIGVATSATGAVWHDICQVISRRWPLARVVLAPCQVQGDGAAPSVVAALDRLARWGEQCRAAGRAEEAPAVVILARGGGSLEDLWSFNDERVVRAVVRHPVPVVCGVGHEVDVTLADFAADVRAPTPSAAAELVVPDRTELAAGLRELEHRARSLALRAVAGSRAELVAEGRALDRLRPAAQLAQARERAGFLLDRATRSVQGGLARRQALEFRLAGRLRPLADTRLAIARGGLERNFASLSALGPQATLDRGYAVVRRRSDSRIVRAPDEAPPGQRLIVQVARGEFAATADGEATAGADRGGSRRREERGDSAAKRRSAESRPGGDAADPAADAADPGGGA
ncbi:MAG TPA: exodeoxyribonuclease VII large subunit [Candidatus Limnocylindrales bacterium]